MPSFDGTFNGAPWFGNDCSISNDLVVIGSFLEGTNYSTYHTGAAYLFKIDGAEVKMLTPGDDAEREDQFGTSVSMDEKIVVGADGNYVQVFSHESIYERTLICDGDCSGFGNRVATLGHTIVMNGSKNSTGMLFVYTTDGELLKELEQGSDKTDDVAITDRVIVSTATLGKTVVYSNAGPFYPNKTEIDRGGKTVAVAGDKIIIGDSEANSNSGVAYLYDTEGVLIKKLSRHDSSDGSQFGYSVAITDDKVLVGARFDDDGGHIFGSVFVYNSTDGEFIEKVVAPDAEAGNQFGYSICTSFILTM